MLQPVTAFGRRHLGAKPVNTQTLPTEFTPEQLEKLNALVQRENSNGCTPEDHNLGRKLVEYCSIARNLQARRRA